MNKTNQDMSSVMSVRLAGRTTHIRFHYQQVYVSTRPSLGTGMPHWVPPVDLYETETEVVLEVDLGGVSSADVQVEFSGQCVTLTGSRRDRAESSATAFHVVEIERGEFSRDIELPAPVEPNSVRADYSDGLLVLRARKDGGAMHGCRRAQDREGLE
jgi:HSP20 family protein